MRQRWRRLKVWWWREDVAMGMAVLIMMLVCAGALVFGDVTGN